MKTLGETASNLNTLQGITHRFFNRQGGVSDGIFESLNVGFASGDEPERVQRNRDIALASLDHHDITMVNCYQVHSNRAVFIDGPNTGDDPRADGLVTRTPKLALSVFTADCIPILFADPEARVIGAAHAGWKGAIDGIIENVLDLMTSNGANLNSICAAAGPSIQANSYEVGGDVYERYLSDRAENEKFFSLNQRGRWQFSLSSYVEERLQHHLRNVFVSKKDTYGMPELYFSARRANHSGDPQYGRMLSAICLT